MELRLQYILHNLGSNTSNKSLVQLNSNAWKQYPPLPRHLWALHENTYTKGKHIRKVICTITGALGKQMSSCRKTAGQILECTAVSILFQQVTGLCIFLLVHILFSSQQH